MSEHALPSDVVPSTEQTVEVRPAAFGLPNRSLVREVRLSAQPGELLVLRAGQVVRRVTVGPGQQVESAVHVGGPLVREKAAAFLGAIDLHAPGGERVARLDLREWVPEADDLLRPDEALRRSGIKPLLERAGLPLRPISAGAVDEALRASWVRIAPLRGLPRTYTVLRSVAIAVAVTTAVVGITTDVPPVLFVASWIGLLASTLAALGLWLLATATNRVVDGGHPVFRPHPGVPVTRRFLRGARLRIEPDEVVLLDALGRERRLPRAGRLAVTHAAVVREGTPSAQVELRTSNGTPRATLPWAEWCGGAGGREALEAVCATAGLPIERGASPAARPAAEEQLAREAYGSPSRRKVAGHTTFPQGLPGPAAVWQTAVFAQILLIGTFGRESPVGTRWMLGLVLVLTVGVHVVRGLVGARWLDRSVPPS